jgi:5-(carboxyamino)imidazole ribonucleotide synthase
MNPLLPGSTVGVLGGGQLGRMLAFEARRMGYAIHALDPAEACPAAPVVDRCITASWDDRDAALALARDVDVLTVETELIPADLLSALEALRPVRPGSKVLRTVQDRLVQKTFLEDGGFPQAPFAPVPDRAALDAAVAKVGLPAVLKARRAGYDGKGQARILPGDDLDAAWARIGAAPAILESFIDFRAEISVVLARGEDGDAALYPVGENVHRHHVLHTTRVPAAIEPETAVEAQRIARGIAEALDHVGVIAVEMFLMSGGEILVNEIAPRTHNSGHYTYGACATSQFEQHLRAICGLPLGDPALLTPVVMVNLLGRLWSGGAPRWEGLLAHPQARLHLYGKAKAAPGRKMGHFLFLGDAGDATLELADRILEAVANEEP